MRRLGLIGLACALIALHASASAQANQAAKPDALNQFLNTLNDPNQTAQASASPMLSPAQEVVMNALGLIGVPYANGGNSSGQGLDCSGFVKLVFQQSTGMVLPRRSEEMSKIGQDVSNEDLQPGDLVFYNTLHRANSHVGIYIGNRQFVHSPSAGGKVKIADMGIAYWKKRFDGAKRLTETTQ
jgi:cell wall-associated NlpC family hydrolase